MKIPPDPLMPGEITGRMLRDFLNGLLVMARSGKIKTDPGSGLESKEMGNFTALWIRHHPTIYIRLQAACGGGTYSWVEQDPIPASPYWQDVVGTNSSGGCASEFGGVPNPAISLNPTDPAYPVGHVVPARRDPVTNRVIIMAGN